MASLLLMPSLLPSGVLLLEYYSGWTEQLQRDKEEAKADDNLNMGQGDCSLIPIFDRSFKPGILE